MCLLYVLAVHDPPAPQPTVVARIPGSRVAEAFPPRGRHPSSGDPDRLEAWGFARFFECWPLAPPAPASAPQLTDELWVCVVPGSNCRCAWLFPANAHAAWSENPGRPWYLPRKVRSQYSVYRLFAGRHSRCRLQGWEGRRYFSASAQNFPRRGALRRSAELDVSGYHCGRTRSEQDPLPLDLRSTTLGSCVLMDRRGD
jgi:hypothetical protein